MDDSTDFNDERSLSPEEKSSIYVLVVCFVTAVTYAFLVPFLGPVRSAAALSLLGLLAFQRVFYRVKKNGDAVIMDERDIAIAHKSAQIGGICSYLMIVILCMGLWAVYYLGLKTHVLSIHALPLIVAAAGVTLWMARSIAVLVLYRRKP